MHLFVHKVDLSQLKKLHCLQLDMFEDYPLTLFPFITAMLSGITRNLRIVKIVFDRTLLQAMWDPDDLVQDAYKLENAFLEIEHGRPHLIFHVCPFMAKNRSLLTYEHLTRCFPHLHKSGRLDVRFESPDPDHPNGMFDLFW